ncbi:Os09g0118233 [Oryza sativa Japonica Group]|uniref:Os09g0118233 protein n=1 Tax=Oryza sativa subsp. japonica TaxID=39947 RepID=A0A0P0XKK1_ORYSJ|nr:Os09g0118233 [Oryza sativa Japonica Group]
MANRIQVALHLHHQLLHPLALPHVAGNEVLEFLQVLLSLRGHVLQLCNTPIRGRNDFLSSFDLGEHVACAGFEQATRLPYYISAGAGRGGEWGEAEERALLVQWR